MGSMKSKPKVATEAEQLEMTSVLEPGFRWGGKRAGTKRVPGRRSSPPSTWLLGTGWHTHHSYLDPREAQRMGR